MLTGYRPVERRVEIADPLREPLLPGRHYTECIERVIGAIMLGVLTHDANLLTITPGRGRDRRP